MNDDRFFDLIGSVGEDFEDIEDGILAELENADGDYRALLHETSEMDAAYPFIWNMLCGEGPITLTAKEHAILFEYLDRERQMHVLERRALYVRGLMDGEDRSR